MFPYGTDGFHLDITFDYVLLASDWIRSSHHGLKGRDSSFILQEKFRAKGNKLYFGCVDLENAFDSVPTEVIRWAICKLRVEEWLLSAVMCKYTGAKSVVRTVYGNSNGTEIMSACTKVQHQVLCYL